MSRKQFVPAHAVHPISVRAELPAWLCCERFSKSVLGVLKSQTAPVRQLNVVRRFLPAIASAPRRAVLEHDLPADKRFFIHRERNMHKFMLQVFPPKPDLRFGLLRFQLLQRYHNPDVLLERLPCWVLEAGPKREQIVCSHLFIAIVQREYPKRNWVLVQQLLRLWLLH